MKKVISLLAAFLIMLIPCFTASAFPSSGSITVTMINKADKQPLSNQTVIAVKVAECTYTEADINFSLDPAYGSGIDLNSPEAAEKLYPSVKGVAGKTAVSDSDGTAVFNGCELGAYLIYSSEETFSPFLAFVPMVTEDGINFNIKAEPKIDIPEDDEVTPPDEETGTDKSSTSTTDKSSEEKLPKTGMLQLPIPILGFAGALIFSEGFILYAKGKKEED